MEEYVTVEVNVYSHIKVICGFESKTLSVPVECKEAFRFVLEWFRENCGISSSSVFLMFNGKGANEKTFAGQIVKSGDVFSLMPLLSGG